MEKNCKDCASMATTTTTTSEAENANTTSADSKVLSKEKCASCSLALIRNRSSSSSSSSSSASSSNQDSPLTKSENESVGSSAAACDDASAWSYEAVASAKPEMITKTEYSEQTAKQAKIIRQLVEEQEKETEARKQMSGKDADAGADAKAEVRGGETGNLGAEPKQVTSESFAQAMDWIQEQIRLGHAKQAKERREARLKQTGKK